MLKYLARFWFFWEDSAGFLRALIASKYHYCTGNETSIPHIIGAKWSLIICLACRLEFYGTFVVQNMKLWEPTLLFEPIYQHLTCSHKLAQCSAPQRLHKYLWCWMQIQKGPWCTGFPCKTSQETVSFNSWKTYCSCGPWGHKVIKIACSCAGASTAAISCSSCFIGSLVVRSPVGICLLCPFHVSSDPGKYFAAMLASNPDHVM